MVGDRGDVSGAVADLPTRQACGTAVAGPVVGDHSRLRTLVHPTDVAEQSTARRAVQEEHRRTIRWTPFAHRQRAAVSCRDNAGLGPRLSLPEAARNRDSARATPAGFRSPLNPSRCPITRSAAHHRGRHDSAHEPVTYAAMRAGPQDS
jgi:hypothetical protein